MKYVRIFGQRVKFLSEYSAFNYFLLFFGLISSDRSTIKPNDEDFIELILNENDQMEVDVQDEVEAVLVENVARKTKRVARGLYKEVPKDQPTMLNFLKRK